MTKGKDDVPLKTHGVADEPTPLMVIPSKAWTQPHGTELYDWVATEVLGTRSKVTKEYLDEMLKENIVFAPNHNTKYKLEVPDTNERICFLNHKAGEVPDWLWAKLGAEVAKESARNEKIAKKSLKAKSRAYAYAPNESMRMHCHDFGITS
ncbi:hypothetical protein PIB30_063899 [Stylosanthes scabra]|uniref:Uncharacterized protein n=1 Tax=Stylosanthes scabra TaxID=79078 RepID=A0ABU6QL23_9FABA|nr:hypothetical protein [Stylosanthes scabra]